jgi:hypothetical protein
VRCFWNWESLVFLKPFPKTNVQSLATPR